MINVRQLIQESCKGDLDNEVEIDIQADGESLIEHSAVQSIEVENNKIKIVTDISKPKVNNTKE
jgi:hypothetical protein